MKKAAATLFEAAGLADSAPRPLADSFSHLTTTFEHKWYGEKACQPDEYVECRDEAEAIRQQAV